MRQAKLNLVRADQNRDGVSLNMVRDLGMLNCRFIQVWMAGFDGLIPRGFTNGDRRGAVRGLAEGAAEAIQGAILLRVSERSDVEDESDLMLRMRCGPARAGPASAVAGRQQHPPVR
jgi:hypothetical protein